MSCRQQAAVTLFIALALVTGTFKPVMAEAASDTALVDAAKSGNRAQIEAILQGNPAAVAQVGPDGTTALHWAVNRDDVEMVDLLIRARADVKAQNRYGFPPIAFAAVNGNAAVLSRMIAAGADANTSVPGGETILMTAARTGDPDAIEVLLKAGAEVNATDASGQTALMWAAAANNASSIAALIARGAEPHPRTKAGLDALMFAVRRGQTAATEALIEAGADVNGTMKSGESVLEVAIVNTHWGLADMLLDRGADPGQAKAGYTALHRLIILRPIVSGVVYNEDIPIPLGSLDMILDLAKKMIAKGVDVNARMTKGDALKEQKFQNNISVLVHVGATAFLLAAKDADLELMELLLAAGADPSIPTFDGTTSLMVAAGLYTYKGSYERFRQRNRAGDILKAVKMCLDLAGDVNAVNDVGDTALHGAAYRGAPEVASFLIDHGAKLDAADTRGLTPLAVASGIYYILGLLKSPKTAELLRSAMRDRGLSTEVPPVDEKRCLYCYLTNRKQRADARQHIRKLEESFARQQRASKR